MIDERLKKYWTIVRHYHTQDTKGRVQMLSGFFQAAARTEPDPKTRGLLITFQMKEGAKYAPANSNPEPPRRA